MVAEECRSLARSTIMSRRPATSNAGPDAAYRVVPAAGLHALTPWFDTIAELLGFGARFKSAIIARAGTMDNACWTSVAEPGCSHVSSPSGIQAAE